VLLSAATRTRLSLLRPGPGELGQVSAAFARMAGTLQREDELRRAVVADTAHELRTPLTILRGATEELLHGLAAPTVGKLTSLHDEVLRLERLVDDLSALAAAQSAALTLDLAPVDLAKVAAHAAAELQAQFEDAEVRLNVDASPAVVNADQARLTQIVTNLLTNAAKFTPARRAGHPHYPPCRRQRGTHRHRHRPRHPARGPAAHLRTVLAWQHRQRPGRHRHRPRRGRGTDRRPQWHHRRRQPAQRRGDLHPDPARPLT
jgi:His Kinase A (phospho-acceptor) domain